MFPLVMFVPLLSLLLFPVSQARPASYAVWAADSGIARGQGNGLASGVPIVSYEHGEFQVSLTRYGFCAAIYVLTRLDAVGTASVVRTHWEPDVLQLYPSWRGQYRVPERDCAW
jgi:hypothetical protein